jgi:flavin reductase (DIM6/NTAB) family NADH-FMN oxidoreductase RutF
LEWLKGVVARGGGLLFYETVENKHGLKHDPFKALVVPRPIGWISTISRAGICNLAPYSFFNAVGEGPHYVVFSSSGPKDSLTNIEETGEFVCSLATFDLRFNMNMTSAPVPRGVDEFPIGELTATSSRLVKPPRVKESPAAFECRHWKTIELPPLAGGKPGNSVVFGQVIGVFIDDTFVVDGMVDTGAMRPIARLGYMDYAVVTPETVFSIARPSAAEAMAKLRNKAAE